MIPFILGALGVVALSEFTKKSRVSKMAHGGGFNQYGKPYGFKDSDIDEREFYIGEFLKDVKYPATQNKYKSISEKTGYSLGDIIYVHQKMNNDLQYNPKYSNGGEIDTKRKMFLHDAVLYKGDLLYITNKNGVLGLANLKRGAWGSDYPFIPISKVNMDDVTDMMGRKISIEGYAKGGKVGDSKIQKKVDEVNRLIELANKNDIDVVDTSGTWQSPMKYKPIRYSNGALYIEYEEFDLYNYSKKGTRNWETKKEKVLKRNMEFENPLNDIAKWYRKALRENGIEYKAIGGLIPTAPNGEEFAEGGEILKWKVDENGFKPTYIIDKENEPDYFQKFGEDKKYAWGVTYGYNVIDKKLGKYSVLWFLTNKQDLINKYPNIIEDVDNLTSIEYVGDLEALSDLKVIFVDNLKDAKKLASEIFNQLNLGKSISEDSIIKKYNKIKISKYAKGGVLSNKLRIVNLEFEDSTDRKLGRYDFSFETIDSEGASVLDYDGYIIESAAESRMPDEIEWGLNVPEDWEGAEDYILDSFYEWKSKKYAKGGGVGNETKNWFSIKFKLPDGRISWTTTYSSMGEKYAKNEVLEDFGATEIIEIRQATKNEINYAVGDSMDYAKGGSISLETFDINDLDAYEKFTYNYMLSKNPKMSKSDILRVIINNVDGDYSQLSPKLSKVAKKLK